MQRNLIATPDDFYHEELPFADPEDMDRIFTELETQNLAMIYHTSEMRKQYEDLEKREHKLRSEGDRVIAIRRANKRLYRNKLAHALSELDDMRQQNGFIGLTEKVKVVGVGQDIGNDTWVDVQVDVERILTNVKRQLVHEYVNHVVTPNADGGNNPSGNNNPQGGTSGVGIGSAADSGGATGAAMMTN